CATEAAYREASGTVHHRRGTRENGLRSMRSCARETRSPPVHEAELSRQAQTTLEDETRRSRPFSPSSFTAERPRAEGRRARGATEAAGATFQPRRRSLLSRAPLQRASLSKSLLAAAGLGRRGLAPAGLGGLGGAGGGLGGGLLRHGMLLTLARTARGALAPARSRGATATAD